MVREGQHRPSVQEEGFHAWYNAQTARAVLTVECLLALLLDGNGGVRQGDYWPWIVTDGNEGFALMIL